MLRAQAVYESDYLLGTSIARPIIAAHQVEVARATGADAVGHGATSKGNDQVRFELTYMSLEPSLKIIAPWKDPSFELRDRESAIDYAVKKGVPVDQTKTKIYSRDRNLWHISHEGADLESPANEPKDEMWMISVPVSKAPDLAQYVTIDFERGNPVAVDGKKMPGHELVAKLNEIGGRHAVGQTQLAENRLVGMKSRGAYETPGGTILYEAHKSLEQICIERDTFHFKQIVSLRYAELVYNGQWFHPLREALQAFIDHTQVAVTGQVKVKLFKGRATAAGVSSPFSLYDPQLASFSMDGYDVTAARGFIDLFGLPMKVASQVRKW
jgi:argininosuccinate synthase